MLLQKILGAHGLKYPGDYDLLTVGGTPARCAAVQKGAVAAAMVTIPTSYEAKEDGLNVLANISTILPDYQFTVIAGNTSWMAGHKDQTVRFLMAMIKAMRFLNDPKNKEASMQSMIKHFKVNKKYAELAYHEVMQELHPINNDAGSKHQGHGDGNPTRGREQGAGQVCPCKAVHRQLVPVGGVEAAGKIRLQRMDGSPGKDPFLNACDWAILENQH